MTVIDIDRIRELRATVTEHLELDDLPERDPRLLADMRAYNAAVDGVSEFDYSSYPPHPDPCRCETYYAHQPGHCSRCERPRPELRMLGSWALCRPCIVQVLARNERIAAEDQSWRDRPEPATLGWRKAPKRRRPHQKLQAV